MTSGRELASADAWDDPRAPRRRAFDPILWYVIGTEVPVARPGDRERAIRLRFRLVAWCAGVGDHVAWHLAMDPTDEGIAAIIDVVSLWPDERLRRALTDARQRRAAGLPPRRVFEG